MKKHALLLSFALVHGAWCSSGQVSGATLGNLSSGLVAWYSGGNTNDLSGHGYNLKSVGVTTASGINGEDNASFYFSGTNSYLISTNIPIPTNNTFSWLVWVRPNLLTSYQQGMAIMNRGEGVGLYHRSPFLALGNGYANFWSYSPIEQFSQLLSPSNSIQAQVWSQIAITSDAYGVRTMYINGSLATTGASSNYGEALGAFMIGDDIRRDLNNAGALPFQGSLTAIRIYNRALSSNEVASLYSYERSPARITNEIKVSAIGMLQGATTTRLDVTTMAPPQTFAISTSQILSWLAIDENIKGSYPARSFPSGSKLAVVVSATDNAIEAIQVVDQNNSFLLDVSDILSLGIEGRNTANISTGKVSAVTGLSQTSATYLSIGTLTFDDSAISGGQNIKFYLSGIVSNQIVNTVPSLGSRSYRETHTFRITSAAGDGRFHNAPMLVSGSITATGSALFILK
jgi:Concanavalin A-like lectin/glucanases superfamily